MSSSTTRDGADSKPTKSGQTVRRNVDAELASQCSQGVHESGSFLGLRFESRCVPYATHEDITQGLIERHRIEQVKIIASFHGVSYEHKKLVAEMTREGWFPSDKLVQILQGLADSGDGVLGEVGDDACATDRVSEHAQHSDSGSRFGSRRVSRSAAPQRRHLIADRGYVIAKHLHAINTGRYLRQIPTRLRDVLVLVFNQPYTRVSIDRFRKGFQQVSGKECGIRHEPRVSDTSKIGGQL